ncbi:MAG TPA: hypothetical protein PLU71_03660 [Candidatus Dependentiae bacterium]|nr:hypothetical protein [Candidatus Dependentiae bacterium]HRQ62928.1 hypothetical protein [Candidatus Dependentiae bacterium]
MNIKKITLIILSITIGTMVPQTYALSVSTKQELINTLNHVADVLVDVDNALKTTDNPQEVLQNGLTNLGSYSCSIDPFRNLDVGHKSREHATSIYNTMLAIIDSYGRDNNVQDYEALLRIAKQYATKVFNPLLLVYHDKRNAPKSAARINKELSLREQRLQQMTQQAKAERTIDTTPTQQPAHTVAHTPSQAQEENNGGMLSNLMMPALLAAGVLALHELYAYNSDNGNSLLAPIFNRLQNLFGNNDDSTDKTNGLSPSTSAPSAPTVNLNTAIPTPFATPHTSSTEQSTRSSTITLAPTPTEKRPNLLHVDEEENTNSAAGLGLDNSEKIASTSMPSPAELLNSDEISRDEDVLADHATSEQPELAQESFDNFTSVQSSIDSSADSFKSAVEQPEDARNFYSISETDMIQHGVGGLAAPSHNFEK